MPEEAHFISASTNDCIRSYGWSISLRLSKGRLVHIPTENNITCKRHFSNGRMNFGGPKPVEMGKEYMVQISEQDGSGQTTTLLKFCPLV